MYKRVLLKLSGEALSSPEAAFDPEILKRLAKELKEVQKLGVELAIVVGGGNFIRGKMMAEMGMNRAQADYMGMLGTVINALAVQNALEQEGVQTRVQDALYVTWKKEESLFLELVQVLHTSQQIQPLHYVLLKLMQMLS